MREINRKYIILLLIGFVLFSFLLNVIQAYDFFSEDNLMNLEPKFAYLGKEWKSMILKEPVVKSIDSFFISINIVFLIIFAVDYSLSIQFLFIVILWFFFVSYINNIFKLVSIFSEKISLIISIAIIIMIGQSGVLKSIVNFFMLWLFGQKELWMKWVIGIGTFIVLTFAYLFLKQMAKINKENREQLKLDKDKMELHAGAEVGKTMSNAAAKIGHISILSK